MPDLQKVSGVTQNNEKQKIVKTKFRSAVSRRVIFKNKAWYITCYITLIRGNM